MPTALGSEEGSFDRGVSGQSLSHDPANFRGKTGRSVGVSSAG